MEYSWKQVRSLLAPKHSTLALDSGHNKADGGDL